MDGGAEDADDGPNGVRRSGTKNAEANKLELLINTTRDLIVQCL